MRFTLFPTPLFCLLLQFALASDGAGELHPLEPYIQSKSLRDTRGDELQKREPIVIEGLLQIRQSCRSGYGLCDNGRCCPLGGKCCTRGCCDTGYWCYSTGCCSLREMGCEQVSCCPVGSKCCRGGGCCRSNYYCASTTTRKGCCPIGKICTGTGGIEDGGDAGGGGGGTPTNRPAATSTSRAPPSSSPDSLDISDFPDITTTPSSNSTSTSISTSTGRPTGSSILRPSPPAGDKIVSYPVSDERITWSSGWVTGSSTCTTSAKKTTTEMETFTVMVSSAQRIYLNVDNTNAAYDVYVNGDRTFFSGLDTSEICAYKQLPPATNSRNINVTVVIFGILRNGRRQSGGLFDWSFQLNEVLVMDSASGASSTGTGSTGSAIGLDFTWFNSLVAMLITGLGLAF